MHIFIIFFDVAMAIKGSIYIKQNHGINPTVSYGRIDIKLFSSLSIYALAFSQPAIVLPVIYKYNPYIKMIYIVINESLVVCY